jgi:hypothetical protein
VDIMNAATVGCGSVVERPETIPNSPRKKRRVLSGRREASTIAGNRH